MNAIDVRVDDLSGAAIARLLSEHLAGAAAISPAKSRHALDLDGLRRPEITFWSAWDGTELAGCGALKELDAHHGEIKSMRTAREHLRKGVATKILERIITEARKRGYRRLSLETGSMEYFEPARRLYAGFGFCKCAPFADYVEDPNSIFMTLEL
jgi:putative acetyltransferase